MLVGFSLVSYLERMNISVAAEHMRPELDLTQVQIGQIFSAFLLGYAALQIPVGMLGDRIGPYRVLAALGWTWGALTLLTGYLPGAFGTGTAAFVTLVAIRFLLGVSIAGVYPLCARTVANWLPTAERAFGYSFVIAGVSIGSAITPPIVAWAMLTFGWRASFYLASTLAFAISLVWVRFGANAPASSRRVGAAERAFIEAGQDRVPLDGAAATDTWGVVLRNRSLMLLTVSYFLIGYVLYVFVFWFFRYLIDVRQFTIVSGGLGTSTPFIVGGLLSPIGGAICDRLSVRWGRGLGRRSAAMAGILLAALCVLIGIRTGSAYVAVAMLSLGFGFQMFAEAAYWAAAMDLGGRATGVATGMMNTANNLGGVISTALTPVLFERFGWDTAFHVCVGVTFLAAILWLWVRAEAGLAALERPAPGTESLKAL
jgi:ACS family glucarate transporter-like MFS transporter